jgi:hypothetical protein
MSTRNWSTFLGIAVLLASPDPPRVAARADGPRASSLWELVSAPLLDRALYQVPGRLASRIASDGSVGENAEWEEKRATGWFIEQQRYGADLIQAGLVRKNEPLIRQGWKILDWGFARQGPDGGFPGTGDPFHSTSFFVEATARALLLTRQAGAADAAEITANYLPKVEAAARWLNRPENRETGLPRNRPYTHRRWIMAAALGMTGELTGDRRWKRLAAEFATDGLSLQTAGGINPEIGGGDINYQALGILMALRYATVADDPALEEKVKAMVVKGLEWELPRIDAKGQVSIEGSTRVGHERGRSGEVKTVDSKTIVQALSMGAKLTGQSVFQDASIRVAAGRKWVSATGGPR